ncbi:Glycine cleavage system transcriptional activator [Orrella dioscoreae]|uniref:Glycine cleavage system transcriptional activator n=2 Tax=Orrella dioscoreae TaxID=1851544 RepID=A0A1C3JXW8_9BURK|nr:Glycine cleavage system transcriptional activator [Orrella dioscoreae]SOE51470.1 Glycine cleavage system transcriptional activator [Orrella dioscoreae]
MARQKDFHYIQHMNYLEQLQHDPPLRAVRAFEAYARLGTLAAAARELAITPSAISHQLRLLDAFLGAPLTTRQGRNLVLTAQGREYYRSLRSAFAVLRGATGHLREGAAPREVSLSVIPMFGMGWFIPHLHEFQALAPGLDVHVSYANHRHYPSDAADLSIRFGVGEWPGYDSIKLLPGAVVPVCHPGFLATRGPIPSPTALAALPLLHDEERGTWKLWLSAAGVSTAPRLEGAMFEDGQLTLCAALAGLGCALLRPPLIQRELDSGQLVQLFDLALDDGRDYYLCHRSGVALSTDEMALRDWLHARTQPWRQPGSA